MKKVAHRSPRTLRRTDKTSWRNKDEPFDPTGKILEKQLASVEKRRANGELPPKYGKKELAKRAPQE